MKYQFRAGPLAACAAAAFCGFLLPLSLAPYHIWPLALLAPPGLAVLLRGQRPGPAFARAFCFGLGMFGSGVSWVYDSIYTYGETGFALALLMTSMFVAMLAFFSALPFVLYARWQLNVGRAEALTFAAVWALGEWMRSWLFTGFPWLYVGYAHTSTWLNGWAPLFGVFFLSYVSVLCGQIVFALLRKPQLSRTTVALATLVLGLWLGGWGLQHLQWTQTSGTRLKVVTLQPNIPLSVKWDPSQFEHIENLLDQLASAHWDADLQVWPEAALPGLMSENEDFRRDIDARARKQNTSIISGVLYDTYDFHFYNGIAGLGTATGLYFKQRLVPFGEYVPFERYLRGLIRFFDLPNSVIEVGPWEPGGLHARSKSGVNYTIAPFICYEVVYPNFVADNAADAQLLVTISNDAWFGRSIGPLQHFQMARMRAIEQRKFMVRATNTGLSGIVDPFGHVSAEIPQFERDVLSGEVELRNGRTPFALWRSWPLLCLCFTLVLWCARRHLISLRALQKK